MSRWSRTQQQQRPGGPFGLRSRKPQGAARRRLVAAMTAVAVLASILVGSIPTASPASAEIQDTRCVAEPQTSTGTQGGVTAVAVRERVRLGTEVDLAEGVVHQDILANPDGSIYISSWLGMTLPAGAAAPVPDPSTLTLTIDGVQQTLLTGSEPNPNGFVLHADGPTSKVYFPGDPAVLADPTGSPLPSYTVPAGGQTFRLTYEATVPNLAAGQVALATTCQAAISYGEANTAVNEREASIAVLGLDARVAKSADLPVLAPSTTVTYSIEVSVPEFDESGEIRNGSAYDTVVTDDLPDGLDYVAGSASNGGTESGGVITWTIPELAAGESMTLTYQMRVPADAAPGAAFSNTASAQTTSQPGAVAGERTFEATDASLTLNNGAAAPGINKSSNVAVAGTNQLVTFTVDLTWPTGSTWHDVTITDLLPDGFTLVNAAASFTCAPVACAPMTTLAPFVAPNGTTRFGRYLAQLGPFAAPQTWRWTYTARMTGAFTGGAEIPLGTQLDNLAEVHFNLIPRLGGVVPNPARLSEYDGVVGDVAPVTFNRPVIAIDKAAPTPGVVDPSANGVTYTVTLTNTGGVDATNVTFRDPGPASSGFPLGSIQASSVTGATFNGGTSTFTVALIPDGEARIVTYRVIGAVASTTAVEGDYENTATLTGYRDPANNQYTVSIPDPATVTVVQPDVVVDKERLSASPIAGTDGETITYRVTLTNVGEATAFNIAGNDLRDFAGDLLPGTCTGGMTVSAAGVVTLAQLAPAATASCDYTVEIDGDQPAGTLDNTVTITWRNGFGQTGEFTPEAGVVPWTSSDDASTTVTPPQLALTKGPEADTPGNVIPNGQTGTYTVTITNVGPVTASDVVLSDTLPAGLTLEATPDVDTTPDGVANNVVGDAGNSSFTVTFPALAPGEAAQVTILVRHDGVEPADEVLVNTATLTADGIPSSLTDTGALVWVPSIVFPLVSKSVSPASVGIGGEVTWTVTATVRENAEDVFDVAIVDTLPRGTIFSNYGAVTCVSGPLCAAVPSPTTLTPAVLATGEPRIGWFVGDVPANTDPTTYTFTFTSTIAERYTGTGSPPAGTSVTDTFLVNRVQPWLTITAARDRYDDGSLPDLAVESLLTQFERRGSVATWPVHVVTPRVIVDKKITNLGDPLVWQTDSGGGMGWMADVGDIVSYELTIENIGGATAYDVDVSDSMGQPATGASLLRNIQITGLPAGVTVVDDWTLADPDVVLHLGELAPDAVLIVTYTGEVAPSAELVPGFGADNRDVALIRNTVEVPAFRSAPAGGGLLFEDTFATGIEAYVYTPSPHIPGAAACVGSPTAPSGTTATFIVLTRNGAPPFGEDAGTLLTTGYPSDPTVGVGYDATLTSVLSPNVRYIPGTARVNGAAAPDPTATVDAATSMQTLVFDLGDVPQDESRNVAFDVRTIADGTQGGMVATLTMDDATGSPSRGAAVPGATYVYQDAQGAGCAAPGEPLMISKVPDLSTSYDGKKRFKVGEDIRWEGDVSGGAAPFHDGELVDVMPAGIDYTPGSAVFVVTPMTGPNVTVSAANGNLTEIVTPLPDGRTELRWTSPVFAEFRSISYRFDSVVGADAIIGSTATNVINLITSDGIQGSCGDPVIAVCDNGQVQIISSATPTVTKSVDHPAGPWGDTFSYTVEVTLPGNVAYFDAYIGDRGEFPRALDPDGPAFANATVECIVGCPVGDPAPIALPAWTFDNPDPDEPDEVARAWFLGDLASQIDARTYRITYEQTFADTAEYFAEFGEPASTEQHVNEAVVGWNDSNVIGTPADTPASSRQFAILSPERGIDDAVVALVTPELTVEKVCQALDGSDDLGTSSSFGAETTGAVPNFRCVLTATNTTDPSQPVTVFDPVLVDSVPTLSVPPDPDEPGEDVRPMTTQLTFWESDEPLVDLVATAVNPPMTPPRVGSLRITAEGLQLEPGASFSVTVDLRLTADPTFWSVPARKLERGRNTVAAQSFADEAGNVYQGDEPDSWDLVIVKPVVTVSQRAWAANGYAESLADGRPTACMAYVPKPEPAPNGARTLGVYHEECTDYKDARGHDAILSGGGGVNTPLPPLPADYARAYSGGAPDVILGVTDQVTWAVDAAIQRPDDVSTVSIVDQIPYGFEYVPGSARIATWSEAGTAHLPLVDPVVGADPAVTCSQWHGFHGGPVGTTTANVTSGNVGQFPWTPLTWTFADGAPGPAGAFWDDGLTYLNSTNRDAAGALDNATPFDRIVRIVFDVRPRAEFADCLHTPERNTAFRSRVDATASTIRGGTTSFGFGWVQGVELARVEKTPDGAITPDGTTAIYGIDVTITDQTRLGLNTAGVPSPPCTGPDAGELPPNPTRTPWVGLGDLSRIGTPVDARFMATYHGPDFRSQLVVTDTFVDDGQYEPGSMTFEMLDPWGRPFAGHLADEEIVRETVDGRTVSTITWTFDYYPSPLHMVRSIPGFPCPSNLQAFYTYPTTTHLSVPLPIPDGTLDGTTHPNTADVRIDHFDEGALVRTQGEADDALITVRNPQPPPPTTKTAVPDEVAPGEAFQWIVEANLQADAPWFDLGWTDELPESMEFVGYGTPSCVVTGTADPCSLAPTTLTPTANGDGSTTLGWFLGDVAGSPSARTVRMPINVRFVGDEVAGDQLTNTVTGFSNDDDLVGTVTSPADPDDFFYTEDVVGVATVVEPLLTITKVPTSDPGPDGAYQAGDAITYEVTVTNTGTGTAYDVPVVDTPDRFLTSVASPSPSLSKGWTALDPRLEWFLPTVAAEEVVTLDVSGVVATDYIVSGVRELTNTATVTKYTSRPETEDDARQYTGAQSAATVPLVAPNLTVAKFAGADCEGAAQAFAPGEPVDWCVVVANTGTAPAYNVTVTDLLPAGWIYDTGSAEVDVDGIIDEPVVSTTTSDTQRLVWTLGQVAAGAEITITYSTIGADGDELVTNTAVVDSTLENGDPVPGDPEGFQARGSAQAAALGAGLEISKTPNQQGFECDEAAGCAITWLITVVNADELDLDRATMTDYLPADLAYGSSTGPDDWSAPVVGAQGSGPSGTTPVTWTHDGTFPSGGVSTFEITALVPPGGTEREFLNHAVARADDVPQVENQALATVFSLGSIGDFVWHDRDTDGVQDTDEPGLAGIAVQLLNADGGVIAATVTDADGGVIASTVTEPDGSYLFSGLVPATYRVQFLVPDGWTTSPANAGDDDADDSDVGSDGQTAEIDLASGVDDLDWDAGLFRLPSYSVRKVASAATARPGDVVTYQVTLTNTGEVAYTHDSPARFTDDLSDVLDDATYNGDATGGATFTPPTLEWAGPLEVGASTTVTYSVTANDPANGNRQMRNVVITPAGGDCEATTSAATCRTTTVLSVAARSGGGGGGEGGVPGRSGSLVHTGTDVLSLAAVAFGLVALGWLLLVLRPGRRHARGVRTTQFQPQRRCARLPADPGARPTRRARPTR